MGCTLSSPDDAAVPSSEPPPLTQERHAPSSLNAQDEKHYTSDRSMDLRDLHNNNDEDNRNTSATRPLDAPAPTRNESVYFDAVMTQEEMDQLADELFSESRANLSVKLGKYAPADTSPLKQHARSSITLSDPDSLLLPKVNEEEQGDASNRRSETSNSTRNRRATIVVKETLTAPKTRLQLEGYPGDLTKEELHNCLKLRQELKSRSAHFDMVHAWHDIEEEAYALCRFLRARQFDPAAVLAMMDENIERFQKAQSKAFYKNIEESLGCPPSVFLTQYPYNYSGSAKNGCPVAYFRAGHVSVDGIDCCTDMDTKLVRYLWYGLKYVFPAKVAKLDPDSARCEVMFVVDLSGLTASMLNSRTIGLFKKLSEATGSFPEILNKTIVLNAPGYFAFSWRIMKGFLHPRTAAKIEIYSDSAQGKKRLAEMIDKKELLSDYGGTSQSFEEIARPEGVLRQQFKLVSFARSGMSSSVDVGTLSKGECMNVEVYSRSKSGADVSVGEVKQVTVAPEKTKVEDDGTYRVIVGKGIKGPGKISINVKTRQTHKSKEHFLVIVDIVAS